MQNLLKLSRIKYTVEGSSFTFKSESDYENALKLMKKIFSIQESGKYKPFAWVQYLFDYISPFVEEFSVQDLIDSEIELASDDVNPLLKSLDKSKFKVDAKKGLVLFKNEENLGLFVDTAEDPETARLSIINEYFVDDTQVTFYSSHKFKNIFIGAFPESYAITFF